MLLFLIGPLLYGYKIHQNKEIKAEEARKGIIKKLIEERKLTKADAEEYINNIFTDKRTIYNKITLK